MAEHKVTVRFTDDTHKLLLAAAAQRRLPPATVAREFIEQVLESQFLGVADGGAAVPLGGPGGVPRHVLEDLLARVHFTARMVGKLLPNVSAEQLKQLKRQARVSALQVLDGEPKAPSVASSAAPSAPAEPGLVERVYGPAPGAGRPRR